MSKLEQEHYYLKFSLVFESHPDIALGDALPVKAMIMQALQSLHGEVGVAAPVDILKCSSTSPTALEAIVRVPYSQLVRVWSALTLVGTYSGTACVVNVLKVSGSLLSLAESSRSFQFP